MPKSDKDKLIERIDLKIIQMPRNNQKIRCLVELKSILKPTSDSISLSDEDIKYLVTDKTLMKLFYDIKYSLFLNQKIDQDGKFFELKEKVDKELQEQNRKEIVHDPSSSESEVNTPKQLYPNTPSGSSRGHSPRVYSPRSHSKQAEVSVLPASSLPNTPRELYPNTPSRSPSPCYPKEPWQSENYQTR
jgi:hypothetical protein